MQNERSNPAFASRVAARRGVTLLEVLMSMAVMVVGLLGLAALIPLGRLEMAEGDRTDNSATLGRSAFRELVVRNYVRPETWLMPSTGDGVITPTGFAFAQPDINAPPYAPIVVDPLMIAPKFFGETVNSAADDQGQAHRTICELFPYSRNLPGQTQIESSMPKIARVSLRAFPTNVAMRSRSRALMMHYDVASRYFRSNDDLSIDPPVDKAYMPSQVFTEVGIPTFSLTANLGEFAGVSGDLAQANFRQEWRGNLGFRQFKGDYSWFFIVQPHLAECFSPYTFMPTMGGPEARPTEISHFRTWVVVCNKRDLRETTGMDLSRDRKVGERAVYVDFLDRNTARLRAVGIADERTAYEVLNVKANSWFAVIGQCEHDPFIPPNPVSTGKEYSIEWYRVLSVGDQPYQTQSNASQWYREVIVTGRDFFDPTSTPSGLPFDDVDQGDNTAYPDVDISAIDNGKGPRTGWGVLIDGVRGVYEKTIFVDRPSLWSRY